MFFDKWQICLIRNKITEVYLMTTYICLYLSTMIVLFMISTHKELLCYIL
jgi:hypothetical protein